MNREELKEYFFDYRNLPKDIIPRDLTIQISKNFVSTIIGPRRAGKTTYLFHLANVHGNALYLNFEDPRIEISNPKQFREILDIYYELFGVQPSLLLFDEIQNIVSWERGIRYLHDLRKFNIVLSGSSSKLLSKEIATQLRGRSLTYLLLPFSFKEYLRARSISSDVRKAEILRALREYLTFGGFPEVVKADSEAIKLHILEEYIELAFFKDMVERHNIKHISFARTLFNYLLSVSGSEVSYTSIWKKFQAGKGTVISYLDYIEDTLFFFFLKKFSWKPHLRESWPRKVYPADLGMVKFHTPSIGRKLEIAVFLELLRRKKTGNEIFFLKNPDYEVDFVLKHGQEVSELIQVTYASEKDEIPHRELHSLLKAADLLKPKHLTVITWDYEDEEKIEGRTIQYIPLWRWLSKCSTNENIKY